MKNNLSHRINVSACITVHELNHDVLSLCCRCTV